MASPARSDETWSLVATTTELVAMAPLPLGEAMTALLASLLAGVDWEREALGPSQVGQPGTELSQLSPEGRVPRLLRLVLLGTRHPSLGHLPGAHRTVPTPAGQDTGLPQPARKHHRGTTVLGREQIRYVVPLDSLEQQLRARGAQRRQDAIRDVCPDQASRQSERPEAARPGPAFPSQVDELSPFNATAPDDRRDVPERAPSSPLHLVRPGEMHTHVPQLVQMVGNRQDAPIQGHLFRLRPHGGPRKPERVTAWQEIAMYLKARRPSGVLEERGQVLVGGVPLAGPPGRGPRPAERLQQRPSLFRAVRWHEYVKISHRPIDKRRIGRVA